MVRFVRGTLLFQLISWPINRLRGVSCDRYSRGQVRDPGLQDAKSPSDHSPRRNFILPGHLHVSLRIRGVIVIWEGEHLDYRHY